MRRLRAWHYGLGAGLAALVLFAVLDHLLPPDLSRARDLSIVVTDENGAILRPFLAKDDRWRLKADVPAVDGRYIGLVKAYEDRRFEDHFGVDPLAVLRATFQLVGSGHVVSGASTITMQTARLLEPRPRNLGSKIVEAFRAVQLELRYSKREILGLYLTLAPYGGNLEGVRAASLAYFGKDPRHLTLSEAALLVALPQSPERLRPDRHPEAARAGRDKVLDRLVAEGAISPRDASEAMEDPVPAARLALPLRAPHLSRALSAKAAPGARIETTIDGTLQSALEMMARREAGLESDGMNLAILVVENATRKIKAYVANANFNGPAGHIDLIRAVRSPGSTLKPFVYGMAFDDLAAHPLTVIEDRARMFGDYAPRNFDRGFQGTITLGDALRYSLNVPAVAMLDRVGPPRFAARLQGAGAHLYFPGRLAGPSLPMILGGVGITLKDLTMLYAGLSEGGLVRPLTVRPGTEPEPAGKLFGPVAAWYVRDILIDSPLPDGFGQARGLKRRPIAFKTGTSYGFRDAWSVGVSGAYTVGVWVGRPDGSTRPGHIGRNAAAPLLLKVFDKLPVESFARPAPPADALIVSATRDLPRALQHFSVNRAAGSGARVAAAPLEIAFPPDGAVVALPRTDDHLLTFRAAGGRGTLYWMVNGEPVDTAQITGRRAYWQARSPGFARVTVIDAAGDQASATVRFVN